MKTRIIAEQEPSLNDLEELEPVKKEKSFLITLIEGSYSRQIPFEELNQNRFYRLIVRFNGNFSTQYHPSFTVDGIYSMITKFGKDAQYLVIPYNAGGEKWRV